MPTGSPARRLSRARAVLRDEGWKGLLCKTVGALLRPVWETRTYRVYSNALPSSASIPPQPAGLRLGFLRSVEDWRREEAAGVRFDEVVPPIDAADAFRRGAFALALLEGERVAHLSWAAPHPRAVTGDPVFRCIGRPGTAFIGPCFTHPDQRGRGLYPWALQRLSAELSSSGARQVWINTRTSNAASVRGIEKAGFTVVQDLPYRRWFNAVWLKTDRGWERLCG